MKQIIESIDLIPNEVLIHVIRNSNDFSWNFLGVKIILTRLNMKILMHKSNDFIFPECCNELKNLLKQSASIPNSQADLKQILSLIG
jgi:hypothetical protein